jgi:hypothetical protein
MQTSKTNTSTTPKTRKGQTQPVEANRSRLTTVQPHDKPVAADKQTLTKLNALLQSTKIMQSGIEAIEASAGSMHGRLANIEAGLPAPDHGISGGYDFPPLSLKMVPKVIPTQEYLTAHDLLARSYFASLAAASRVRPSDVYAAFVGSGALYMVSYFHHCANHSEARDQAITKAEGIEYGNPAEILVIGPWQGDPNLAPVGAIIAVRWSTSMYEVEDPYTALNERSNVRPGD